MEVKGIKEVQWTYVEKDKTFCNNVVYTSIVHFFYTERAKTKKTGSFPPVCFGVGGGARTHDLQIHNLAL